MAISYEPLFDLMKQKGIKKIDLRRKGIHPKTVSKLVKNQSVTTETIDAVCEILHCQPGEIMIRKDDES